MLIKSLDKSNKLLQAQLGDKRLNHHAIHFHLERLVSLCKNYKRLHRKEDKICWNKSKKWKWWKSLMTNLQWRNRLKLPTINLLYSSVFISPFNNKWWAWDQLLPIQERLLAQLCQPLEKFSLSLSMCLLWWAALVLFLLSDGWAERKIFSMGLCLSLLYWFSCHTPFQATISMIQLKTLIVSLI